MIGMALHDGGRVLAEHVWRGRAHHTTDLAPNVALMMQRAGVKARDLSAVAVAIGPGSYTGLRIGLALAKGLSLACNSQIAGIPTLDILAHAQPAREGWMAVLIQAGRGRFAVGWYKLAKGAWRSKGEPETVSWLDLLVRLQEPVYVCGELTAQERESLLGERPVQLAAPALCVRRPAVLADLAWESIRQGKLTLPDALAPHYLGSIHEK
jgi:tRNA threonylcarbamoyladenosine biosynthesis protein TsaB